MGRREGMEGRDGKREDDGGDGRRRQIKWDSGKGWINRGWAAGKDEKTDAWAGGRDGGKGRKERGRRRGRIKEADERDGGKERLPTLLSSPYTFAYFPLFSTVPITASIVSVGPSIHPLIGPSIRWSVTQCEFKLKSKSFCI